MPEQGQWAYSIRLRLLPTGHDDALQAMERGFDTCQLTARHWATVGADGRTNHVRGARPWTFYFRAIVVPMCTYLHVVVVVS
jgi:hypothetical protein